MVVKVVRKVQNILVYCTLKWIEISQSYPLTNLFQYFFCFMDVVNVSPPSEIRADEQLKVSIYQPLSFYTSSKRPTYEKIKIGTATTL